MSTNDLPTTNRFVRLAQRLGPFMALMLLMIVFKIALSVGETPSDFWSLTSLRFILLQTSVVAIAACGMTLIIVSGGIDLSVGSVVAFASVVGALVLQAGGDPFLAILAATGAGAAIGALNGSLIAGFGLTPFVVTLGMMGVARGAAKLLADNGTVRYPENWLGVLMQPIPRTDDPLILRMLLVAPSVWLAALTALIMALIMRHTVFGRHSYVIGSNELAARLCGIRVRTTKIAIYAVAGALFGFAGLLTMAQQTQGDSTIQIGMELDVIAAVVIGGATLSGGVGTIVGTIIGALIMSVLRAGTQQLNWSTAWQEILIGGIIILAIGIDRLRNKKQ